jgi:hypothetical protein
MSRILVWPLAIFLGISSGAGIYESRIMSSTLATWALASHGRHVLTLAAWLLALHALSLLSAESSV